MQPCPILQHQLVDEYTFWLAYGLPDHLDDLLRQQHFGYVLERRRSTRPLTKPMDGAKELTQRNLVAMTGHRTTLALQHLDAPTAQRCDAGKGCPSLQQLFYLARVSRHEIAVATGRAVEPSHTESVPVSGSE
jgi:hypothetical protein